MVAKFLTFFGLVAAAAAIAVPVGPAQYTYAQAPAQYTYAQAPAQVTYAQAPVQVAYAKAPVQVAYAKAPIGKVVYAEQEAPANYQYSYSVHDDQSGDVKQQQEERAGDAVHGSYSLVQPDGVHRIVEYTSDKEQGFNAVVRYEGTPVHPAPAKVAVAAAPVYASAPVTKIAYSQAPVAKVAYAPAPITKVAYAPAPITKVAYAPTLAYSQGPAQVTYSQAPAQLTYAQAPAQISYNQGPAQFGYAQAPVAKLAYAPNTKVAYSQNLGHVTFSSPSVSYQH